MLLCFTFSKAILAQFSLDYKFSSKFDFSSITSKYDLKAIDELEVMDEQVVEYAYDKDGNLFEYYYLHQVEYVNSDNAIDRNNKIYISSGRSYELVNYDVRVVLSNGDIKVMGKDALKEGVTEDKRKVQYFAVSGAEKGSFIEYYYLVKRDPVISGSIEKFQGKAQKGKVVIKIISPENLIFTSKSLNGFSDLKSDTSLSGRNMLIGELTDVPKVEGENFANVQGNVMKVVYQLYLNTAKGKKNPFNYGLVSQNFFENVCNSATKDEIKMVNKILKVNEIKYAPDDESKIRAIEGYIKKNFNFVESDDERLQKIETIIKLSSLNENGATKLFYQLFDQSGIETELVVTSNRFKTRFEKDFESYAFLNSYLLYFPKINKYMSPFGQLFRLGLIPYGYIETYGLFIKKVSLGEINTGAGKVKYIPALAANATQHNMFVNAKFDPSMDSLNIEFKQEFTGYYAQNYQPIFDYISTDKLKEFEESIVKSLNPEITIKKIKVENKGGDNLMVNPLVINSNLSSSHFINRAGPKFLLKIGDLIGPQSELYQEKNRSLPVENDFNREYHRLITFIIPDGYVVKNMNDLNMSVVPFKNEGDGVGFTSSYKLEGNKLTVNSDEYYRQINFPLGDYEKYRSVINAAANFNKIVLVLEKQ